MVLSQLILFVVTLVAIAFVTPLVVHHVVTTVRQYQAVQALNTLIEVADSLEADVFKAYVVRVLPMYRDGASPNVIDYTIGISVCGRDVVVKGRTIEYAVMRELYGVFKRGDGRPLAKVGEILFEVFEDYRGGSWRYVMFPRVLYTYSEGWVYVYAVNMTYSPSPYYKLPDALNYTTLGVVTMEFDCPMDRVDLSVSINVSTRSFAEATSVEARSPKVVVVLSNVVFS